MNFSFLLDWNFLNLREIWLLEPSTEENPLEPRLNFYNKYFKHANILPFYLLEIMLDKECQNIHFYIHTLFQLSVVSFFFSIVSFLFFYIEQWHTETGSWRDHKLCKQGCLQAERQPDHWRYWYSRYTGLKILIFQVYRVYKNRFLQSFWTPWEVFIFFQ